jgi:[acyl-carrier-protein] S-malonyltransferase
MESPKFVNETNMGIFQVDLPQAIKVASRFPSNHPSKADRLSFVDYLIMQGANPMQTMRLQGEESTPMQRAIDYGDPQVIQVIKEAMERFAKGPPVIIVEDIDMYKEERKTQLLPVAILFPGQGSQYVGMLKDVKDLEPCKKLIDSASEILGYNILDLCMNGPEEKLEETKYCQPALFLANACALEKLRMEKPEVVERASATAGLSLGEYNSLWYAGVVSFEDCMRIVRVRADAMHEEAKKKPQGMISVAGLSGPVLEDLCVRAAQQAGTNKDGSECLCVVSNHLFPKGYTCSGDKAALAELKKLADEAGALQARELKTAGAFHTKYMEPAGLKLLKSLRAKVTDMNFPKCDMYMNVRGAPQRMGTDPRELNYDLAAQVASPVLWQEGIEEMIKNGITEFYECGPQKQLKAMMKRINQDVWPNTFNVHV